MLAQAGWRFYSATLKLKWAIWHGVGDVRRTYLPTYLPKAR